MTTPTDDRKDLLTVVATMRSLPGKEDELRAALEALVAPTLAEDGCVNYDLHQGTEDPRLFAFYENWESAGHLDAHLQTPHLVEISGRLEEFLEGGAEGLVIRRMSRIA